MLHEPPGDELVVKTRQRKECLEARLVLDSTGIAAETIHQNGWWLLVVRADDWERANAELNAYRRENPIPVVSGDQPSPIRGGAKLGVLLYAITLVLVTFYEAQATFGLNWFTAGRLEAGRVTSGEWWRIVTALMLHQDVAHLAGNLVFGAVFGFLAGRALGGGVAWLGIILAGALGNLINAFVQPAEHLSIGASTAVFAALGIIVAHGLRRWRRSQAQEKPLKRWSPLIGGILLLAFTGVGGENTDVIAHLTGFLAGLLIGWLGNALPSRWLASPMVQATSGAAAILLAIVAWTIGLRIAG